MSADAGGVSVTRHNTIRAWTPDGDGRCGELNPQRTHYCDQPANHDGDHTGPELPTVEIDE